MAQNIQSTGRGGAGNIGANAPSVNRDSKDLVTPTIKSDVYTTGRGGSGNMAKNDPRHPELARASQDVEALPARREHAGDEQFHYGRGGAANVASTKTGEGYKGENVGEKAMKEEGAQNVGLAK